MRQRPGSLAFLPYDVPTLPSLERFSTVWRRALSIKGMSVGKPVITVCLFQVSVASPLTALAVLEARPLGPASSTVLKAG